MSDDILLSSREVCAAVGISYRQLDFWVNRGYITPTVQAKGPGSHRRWTLSDLVEVGNLVQRLRDCPLGHGTE